MKGIWLEEDYHRTYPTSTLASDVLGFTVDGNVGNGGIEGYYNSILNGTDGREYGYLEGGTSVERTVKGTGQRQDGGVHHRPAGAERGGKVYPAVQRREEEQRDAREGSKNTAVMVMNPQNRGDPG